MASGLGERKLIWIGHDFRGDAKRLKDYVPTFEGTGCTSHGSLNTKDEFGNVSLAHIVLHYNIARKLDGWKDSKGKLKPAFDGQHNAGNDAA
ncbi:MAG: hypothetical protein Q9181_007773, partial [Wetmoreana brouardii]